MASLLAIYLNDHLAGSTAGVELARRLAVLESKTVPGYPRRRAVLPV